MAKVIVALTMSLDGFIAGPNDEVEQPLGSGGRALFDWYFDGDTPVRHYREAVELEKAAAGDKDVVAAGR